jgi:predicted dehydrogenase
MEAMERVRWGIVGAGDVTEVKSGPALQLAEGSELVAVMRRDGAKARDYAQRHGVPRWYDDADELIADPDVDAVYVATPPASHKEYTLRAAAAGKPVYVEKPMARNAEEAREMIEACEAAEVPLFVAYYRRALPRFELVRDLLRAQLIGAPHSVSVVLSQAPGEADRASEKPWRLQPEISGGGYFVDLGAHMIDVLDYLFGPIQDVGGMAVNHAGLYEPEDTVTAWFSFESGVLGSGTWCFVANVPEDRIVIHGSAGRIHFSSFNELGVVLERGYERKDFPVPNPRHVQLPLVQSVVDALRGRGSCPSTGLSALRTTQAMDRILATYYGRR